MFSFRHRLRLARRIENALAKQPAVTRAGLGELQSDLEHSVREIQSTCRLLEHVAVRGWPIARVELVETLTGRLNALSSLIDRGADNVGKRFQPTAKPADLLLELAQLEDEFGTVEVDWKRGCLSVTTDAITLEDVDLGEFAIELHWDRLGVPGSRCFDIVALEPRPAASDSGITHPHVRDRTLCAGDAGDAIGQALEQGRLVDAVQLVASVLRNYNRESPFVALDDWDGEPCGDCGRSTDEDSSCCGSCGDCVCDRCVVSCSACDASRCAECVESCAVCDDACCRSCAQISAASSRSCCPDCLEKCEQCKTWVASDEIDEASQLCPDCAGQTESQDEPANRINHATKNRPAATAAPASADVHSLGVAQADVVLPSWRYRSWGLRPLGAQPAVVHRGLPGLLPGNHDGHREVPRRCHRRLLRPQNR